MAYVTFSHDSAITVEAPAVVTWAQPVAGQPGTATVRLRPDSAALSSTYINPDGNSVLRVSGDADLGEWRGYVTEIDEGPGETVIRAVEWWGLLARMPVSLAARVFRHVTPAVIVKYALSASPWQLQTAAEAGPDIPSWTFYGESVWDHVQRMMELSNQELVIEDDQVFRWGAPSLTRYSAVLVAPHDLQEARQGTQAHEMAGRVSVISGQNWYTAVDAEDGWLAHAVIKESLSPAAMASRAENELQRRSQPLRTVSGTLARAHRALGFGDVFSVFIPYAGLGEGRLRSCRILSKSYDDATGVVGVSLRVLTDLPVASAAFTATPSVPGVSKLVQQLKQQERESRRGRRYLAETT